MFTQIVLAYDDSPGARQALVRAVEMANREHATVTAVAVKAHLPHYGATVGEVEEERLVEEQATRRWLAAALAYADEHGVTLATEIRAGHPAHELVRAAAAHHADLVIIGHSGHSAIWGRFIGSTAEKVPRGNWVSGLIWR